MRQWNKYNVMEIVNLIQGSGKLIAVAYILRAYILKPVSGRNL